jgi:threonine/homoserine/homoserine lactone efflux protein
MFRATELLSFAAAAFTLIVVPGPSVIFVISRGVALGRRAALATVLGNTLGSLIMAISVSFGLGTVVSRSVAVFNTVKLVGAAYLVYLGLKMFLARRQLAQSLAVPVSGGTDWKIAREGFVVGITNPKVMIFFGAVLSQFVHPERGSVQVQMIVLALIFQMIALISDSAWALVAGTARQWLRRSPNRLSAIGGLGGVAIGLLGVRLALTGRRD